MAHDALWAQGKGANAAGDFRLAYSCFRQCYDAMGRVEMRISAANMLLKLGEAEAAALEYRAMLDDEDCSEQARAAPKLGLRKPY
eukprot:6343067-Prymnesium_polylepis.1